MFIYRIIIITTNSIINKYIINNTNYINGNISDETVALLDDTTKTKLISSLKAETLKALQDEYNARYADVIAIRNLEA